MRWIGLLIVVLLCQKGFAQHAKPDTVFFNLYTDSLKPGTYNYINVVAKYGDRYSPLDSNELIFTADTGNFSGNEWYIAENFKGDSIKISVTHRQFPNIQLSQVIYIKKGPSAVRVKTLEEIMRSDK